jgi:hypothetical protein
VAIEWGLVLSRDDFSRSRPYQIVLAAQVKPWLIQVHQIMPLAGALHREDAQQLAGHVDPDPHLVQDSTNGGSIAHVEC